MPSTKLIQPNYNFIPQTENVAIQLTQINLQDPKLPNFENDYASGLLLHYACGIKAKFDHLGNPKTEIEFRIRKPNLTNSNQFFPSIANLTKQQENWEPIPIGSTIILKQAFLDKATQSLSCGTILEGARNPSSGLEACLAANSEGEPYLMCVEQQRFFERSDGQKNYYQHRILLDQSKAQLFRGVEQFKVCAIELLDQAVSSSPELNPREHFELTNNSLTHGVPGVIIRCADIGLEHNRLSVQTFSRRLELGWDPTEKCRHSPIESVDNFINKLSNSDWMDEIEQSKSQDTHFELIPYQRFNTGFHELPVHQSGVNIHDDSIQYDSPLISVLGDLIINDSNEVSMGAGFAPSILVLTRSGEDLEFQWNAKASYRIAPTGPIAPLSEVITPTLPDELKEIFADRANERAEIIVEKLTHSKEDVIAVTPEEKKQPELEAKNDSNDYNMAP